MIKNARCRRNIREEEALEKRGVKTLLDREFAQIEREKLLEKR